MIFFQLRTSYPEDTFLQPIIWVGFIILGLGLALSVYYGAIKSKEDKETKNQNKGVKINRVQKNERYFITGLGGQPDIEIEKHEVAAARKQGLKITIQ